MELPSLRSVTSGPRPSWAGPLPALPRALDSVSEGWWRLPPRLRLLAFIVLVVLVGFGVVRRGSATPWGPPVEVVVAAGDLDAGQPVAAMTASRPASLVPSNALERIPSGRMSRDVTAGEVLTSAHVVADLDDLLENGEVAIALSQQLPGIRVGSRLEILGTGFDGLGDHLGPGRLLAVDGDQTWVAIDQDRAPAIAAAMTTGSVTVALAADDADG